MSGTNGQFNHFTFGEFRLEIESQTLWRESEEIHLPQRPFRLLLFLIKNRERVISRDDLLDKFWDGHDVYDDALRKCVGSIRRALKDTKKPPRFIETRYGGGFRFIGEAREISGTENRQSNGFSPDSVESNADPVDKTMPSAEIKPNIWRRRYILFAGMTLSLLFIISLGFYVNLQRDAVSNQNIVDPNSTKINSIAILAIENLTGDAGNEYFSDGITESIIAEMSRIGELRVISRSSTFALKGKEIDPREIGRKLNVEALLEGSLKKKGGIISVNVRVISTKDGSVLWTSQNFERPIATAFELQDTIACNLAIELRAEFCGIFTQRNTGNPDAYQAYLKGRFQWNKRTAEGIKQSIEFYNQAINLDSNYALAYAGLAESYVQGIWYVPFNSKEVLPKAEKAALKSIELDNSLAEARTALASVYLLDWKWPESERELQRAIELNPRYARAHHVRASYFVTLGRFDEAIAAIRRAKELDPLNLIVNTDEANMLFISRRIEEAFGQWQRALELGPNSAYTYRERSIAYQVLGNESASIEDYSKFLELNGKSADSVAEYRRTASKYGLRAIWQKDLNDLLVREKRGQNIPFVGIAIFYTMLGQREEAFKYLEKAYTDHSAELVLLKPYTPFASLHSDPRYTDLLKRLNLPETPQVY
ncbi:MAG: winged helix-turn-helix domain-containing tetratricopeptide repeat protein [Pyrinomonadaceae bacterium]